jgi:hypothetical protein
MAPLAAGRSQCVSLHVKPYWSSSSSVHRCNRYTCYKVILKILSKCTPCSRENAELLNFTVYLFSYVNYKNQKRLMVNDIVVTSSCMSMGLSIYYVIKFLATFDPLPLVIKRTSSDIKHQTLPLPLPLLDDVLTCFTCRLVK